MDNKKHPPTAPSLGTIPGTLGRGRGERLTSFNRRDPNLTVGRGLPKPEFTPNLAAATQRIKKEETADIDSKLQQRGLSSALLDPTKHTFKPVARFRPITKPKTAGQGLDVPVPSADNEPAAPTSGFKKREQSSDVAFSNKISTKELYMDPSNPNHPSVLPFVDPRLKAMESDDLEKEALIAKLKKEAIEMEVEGLAAPEIEVSSEQIPTPLMYKGDFLNEDNLFFIQLPSALPFQPSKNTPTTTTTTTAPNTTAPNTTANPPPARAQRPGGPPSNEFVNTMRGVSGHVGKILVYKSGKVKFKIGDYLYDITAANNPNFLEELMVLGENSCYRVGPMDQHLIVTPDIEDLLRRADKNL